MGDSRRVQPRAGDGLGRLRDQAGGRPGFRPRFFIDLNRPDDLLEPLLGRGPDLQDSEMTLNQEDSYHALTVLRLGVGDECEVVVTSPGSSAVTVAEPTAAVYAATVTHITDAATIKLTARLEGAEAGATYESQVGVVQALARPAAVDHLLEKGTEVGASFFVLVESAGSPRRSGSAVVDRLTRWRRIVREAAKQSKQTQVPPVYVAGAIEEALVLLGEHGTVSVLLQPDASSSLAEVVARAAERPAPLALWVGPESGWTTEELHRLSAAGLAPARLGRGVLRTETAGPVAVAVARLALGDW